MTEGGSAGQEGGQSLGRQTGTGPGFLISLHSGSLPVNRLREPLPGSGADKDTRGGPARPGPSWAVVGVGLTFMESKHMGARSPSSEPLT